MLLSQDPGDVATVFNARSEDQTRVSILRALNNLLARCLDEGDPIHQLFDFVSDELAGTDM